MLDFSERLLVGYLVISKRVLLRTCGVNTVKQYYNNRMLLLLR